MSDNLRLWQLLDELLNSHATPEEVCTPCPELLPEVRVRWREMCRLRAELEVLFPTPLEPGMSPPPLLPGGAGLPQVPGYEVEAVLGRGGMGVVYKARHLRLNRAVALKMLLAGAAARPQELERFLREAEAVAGLRHANIVQVYDVGDLDGRAYFTMEFVEAGSLAQKVEGRPQPARQAATLVATVAEAIQVAHQSGIIHRDLTPANILLTQDGTPKIADFGLARRLDGDGGLTVSGVPVGTPNYMAPEQARGQREAIGPATDVYALGAILYKLLTGRPPFRAETAAATLQRLLTEDPAPPSRLNSWVPRDLETICLKSLQKEPARRYASAAALALDLNRFLRGEPIAARPAGRIERGLRWLARRPALAAALAASMLLAFTLGGVGLWLNWANAERRAENQLQEAERRGEKQRQHDEWRLGVLEGLAEVGRLQEQSRWAEARVVLKQAKSRLGNQGPDDLRTQLDQAGRQLDLVARLDAIRLKRATFVMGKFNNRPQADREYQETFREAGLGKVNDEPAAVAARIRASPVRAVLTAALDDWAGCTSGPRQAWLLDVARRADPDPWRDRLRDPEAWRDKLTLEELTRATPVADHPVPLLVVVGERLRSVRKDPTAFLKRVQSEHPGDFWANFTLGHVLWSNKKPGEAIGFFRAALAIRRVAAVHNNLGAALVNMKRLDEAIEQFERALEIDAGVAMHHYNLGYAWELKDRPGKAIASYRQALEIDPKYAIAHHKLGVALFEQGELDEAIACYRKVIELEPRLAAEAHCNMGDALQKQGRFAESLLAYKRGHELGSKQPGWRYPSAAWVREAEILAAREGKLSAFRNGDFQPRDAAECLGLVGVCRAKKLHAAAARLYAAAFASEPKLAEDLIKGLRYSAACSAAVAGCGGSADGAKLSEEARARWRKQARDWLRQDLAGWSRELDRGNAQTKVRVRQEMQDWQTDDDFAGLREPSALDKLSPDERKECAELWQEVAAVISRSQTTR